MKTSMKRREFLKVTVSGSAAAFAILGGCSSLKQKSRKPNLLFIWTDEQRADTMAVYGNTRIEAPNLDRLAAESIVFRRAYVSQPVCTPSRSTVMTGLWPHTSGLLRNNIPLPEDVPCLNELLADPEYSSAYMGKWHLGDEVFRQHHFGEWESMEDGYYPHYREGKDRSSRSSYHHFLVSQGYEPDREDGTFSRGFAARRPIEQCKPKFLETKACDFLRRNKNNPFILYVNFLEPHMPFFGPLNDKYSASEMKLPENYDHILGENDPVRMRTKQISDMNSTEPEELRTTMARYWGLVTQVDLSVGAILKTLDDLGLADSTIVVFTSDHGDMMGSHRMMTKSVMLEEATRVPWLMRIPSMGRKQRIIENPVSQIDMVPTLLDLMGCKKKNDLPGQSLIPLIRGEKIAEDHVYIEWNERGDGTQDVEEGRQVRPRYRNLNLSAAEIERARRSNIRTVISPDGWKLSLSDNDKCQLFNHNDDPEEINNLFYSGKHQDVIDRLTKKIHEWQKRAGDTAAV